ncbi:ABC transporter ATP-binding protein [Rouxiella badensis]|uniref:ABC transporter ATP-binding protein n=1 Tax=Rouxiella badensis TaxID=1646377 RepID=UPI0022AACA7F|nr:ABC transporter ATP-binding protein [Rouxiella badensis]WAT10586.1 ABC transporter ATP-binding protein [Rouxiella badensis]
MGNPLLQVEQLVVVSSDKTQRRLVDNVSFDLKAGEVLGLIGESGAGKSTIGLAILGHCRHGMRIASGSIRFNGTELARQSQRQLRTLRGRKIAYVAQSSGAAFNPAITIGEQVIEATLKHRILPRQQAQAKAIELFTQLGLPEPAQFYQRYPHQVSGGQLQRAMIAMALCAGPELLIFDEPTTALDVTTQLGVLKAIADVIRLSGVAAIYISHDLAVVAQISNRIMVLQHGKTVEHATTERLLHAPEQDYTKRLLTAQGEPREAMPMNQPELLRIDNISARYHHQPVLKNLSLSLPRGRTLAVIGESGSGKSTLGKVICGLHKPENGEVSIEGQALSAGLRARSRQQLRDIQLIHQIPDTALNPKEIIGKQISRVLECFTELTRQQRAERVSELLTQVGLSPELAARYPAALSGGQKQRVCIARALAAEPKLIVCDEPTSALDPLVARDVLALLRQIQHQTGISYLFITHDLKVVREVADEVAVLFKGEIVRNGSVNTTLSEPLDNYTRELLRSVPEMRIGWLEEQTA